MAEPTDSPAPAIASPFAVPIFRAVWIASLVSSMGGMIQSVGAAWTMVALAGSPQMVALVSVSVSLPVTVLALLSGAIADSLDRRLVQIVAQSFMLVASIGLALCAWAGLLTPWLLLAFTFLIGCGMALNSPAWQASVGEMVPRTVLPAAVAYNAMQFNVARSLGPAIGGFIVQVAGATFAFLINALSYVGLILVLWRWRPETPPRTLPREPIRAAMAAGIRYVWMSPHLGALMVRTALFGSAAAAIPALMPVIARDAMSGDAQTYGILLGAFGLGGVAGAGVVGRLRRALSNEAIARISWTGVLVATLVTALSTTLFATAPALALAGACWLFGISTFNATTQLSSPRWVVGRALSLYQTCAFAGLAVGSWAFGWVAEHQGVAGALLVACGWQVLSGLVGLRFRLPRVDDLNLDPLRDWREPDTMVPVDSRSGPVVVTIEYRIDPADIPAFLREMNERRRVRRRDGAYGWTLLRDLSDPELWLERYHVPTWVDYVRHNQRRTHEDAANFARILDLHRGEARPRVRRMLEQEPWSPLPARDAPPAALGDTVSEPG